MNKVIEYLDKLTSNYKVFNKKITVYGWEFNYEYEIISSIVPYLFEELVIKENIASETNINRDGRVKEKKYITIHDTGDTNLHRGAAYWSDVVKNEYQKDTGNKYAASFHYVVGSDGIYHNIPDNEVAYHAGDTTKYDYKLYDTKIPVDKTTTLEVRDNYYYINNQNTMIKVESEDLKLATNDINDQGILIKNINDIYYIGETYYNSTYKKIANRGGNNNSIGMEVCVNQGTDIYRTWQLSAKLTAYLMDKNSMTIDDVKQHHYFSGKNCPMTLRENHLYNDFIQMIRVEYDLLQFIKEGYQIKLESLSSNVMENGRITDNNKPIKARIKVIYNNEIEYYDINY